MDSFFSALANGLKLVEAAIEAKRQPPLPPPWEPRQFTNNYQQPPRQSPRPNQFASNSNHTGPAPPHPRKPRQFTDNYQRQPRQPPRPNQSASNSNHPGPAPPPYSRFPPSYNESEHGKRDNRATTNRNQQYRRPNNQRRNQENGSDVHVHVKIIQNPNHHGPVITKVTTTAKQQPKSKQNGGQSYKKKQQANKQQQQANKN